MSGGPSAPLAMLLELAPHPSPECLPAERGGWVGKEALHLDFCVPPPPPVPSPPVF